MGYIFQTSIIQKKIVFAFDLKLETLKYTLKDLTYSDIV